MFLGTLDSMLCNDQGEASVQKAIHEIHRYDPFSNVQPMPHHTYHNAIYTALLNSLVATSYPYMTL